MRLSSILLARALAFVESFDLNPRGRVFYPELVQEIVKRYNFQKFPRTLEEFDETKGVEFHEGRAEKIIVQKFTIFNSLLVMETRSSTSDSQQVILEMLEWGKENLGLTFKPEMISHWGFVSDLSFFSEVPLLASSPLTNLANRTSTALSEIWKEPFSYVPMITTLGHDPLARKNGIAPFTIQRRGEVPFSQNKYFSEAPLPTEVHIKLLEQYEADVTQLKLQS